MAEKRAKHLCFYCDQRYSPSYKCSGKMYCLEVIGCNEIMEDEDCVISEQEPVHVTKVEEDTMPQVSLNAMNGDGDRGNERKVHSTVLVNGLEAYDGEINLEQDKNLISNEFTVKLCLEHELDPFLDNSKETEKSEDDWELILDGIDFEDILNIDKVELPPFVCKMGKSTRNKRRLFENHQINYFDEGPSLNNGQLLTQKKVIHEATAIDIYKRFYILEEARPVIETMAYSDKYKKILDSIFLDKQKLDGEIKQEEEEAVTTML
ncbi:hypothetical protein Tco_0579020 [Tanacetum coccineum]